MKKIKYIMMIILLSISTNSNATEYLYDPSKSTNVLNFDKSSYKHYIGILESLHNDGQPYWGAKTKNELLWLLIESTPGTDYGGIITASFMAEQFSIEELLNVGLSEFYRNRVSRIKKRLSKGRKIDRWDRVFLNTTNLSDAICITRDYEAKRYLFAVANFDLSETFKQSKWTKKEASKCLNIQ